MSLPILHTWIYGLIYPAFLGAVLAGLFANGLPPLLEPRTASTATLVFYFLTQYGEGIGNVHRYTGKRFLTDGAEQSSC